MSKIYAFGFLVFGIIAMIIGGIIFYSKSEINGLMIGFAGVLAVFAFWRILKHAIIQ